MKLNHRDPVKWATKLKPNSHDHRRRRQSLYGSTISAGGIVEEIKVSVGDKTQTGALIMIFDLPTVQQTPHSAQAEEKKEAARQQQPAAAAAKDVNVPDIG